MKTITPALVGAAIALCAGSAFADGLGQRPAATAVTHPVAMNDAALSRVVAGAANPSPANGIGTALAGPSASTPNFGATNGGISGLLPHAWANAGGVCQGLGQVTAALGPC